MKMDADEYIAQRLDDQIAWYSRKSAASQRAYKRLRIVEIVVAASIPLLAGFSADALPALRAGTGLAGVIVAVAAGLLALNQYQEKWIQYRTTCESLLHQKYLFLTGAEPYSDAESAFGRLVENVEALLSQESSKWAGYMKAGSNKRANG